MLRNAIASLLLALAGCDGHYGYRKKVVIGGSFDLPAGTTRLAVQIHAGNLSVEPGESGKISYEAATLRASDTAAELRALEQLELVLCAIPAEQPGTFRLAGPELPAGMNPMTNQIVIKAVLRVPKELAVELKTGLGHVSARRMQAAVALHSGAGDLAIQECKGEALARTGNGAIVVDAHRGSIDVESGGGGKEIVAFVRELGPSGMRIINASGGIQAHLARDAAFELDLRAPVGKLICSWDLPKKREDGGVLVQGVVGGGGPKVYIESLRGSVSLKAEQYDKR